MFDLGWSELTVLAVVILVVIGPKELPQTMRTIGVWVGKARRLANEFKSQVNDMIDDSDLAEVRDEVQKIGRVNVEDMVDPDGEVRKGLEIPDDDEDVFEPQSTTPEPPKTTAKSVAAAKKTPVKKAPAKKASAKKALVKKASVKKAPVKRAAAAKKPLAKKPAAKKPAAKKPSVRKKAPAKTAGETKA